MTQNVNFNIFLIFNEIRFLYKTDYNILSIKLALFKISVKTLISIF